MKPGIQTTEFWFAAIVSILGLCVSQGWIGVGFPQEQVLGLVAMFLPSVVYVIGRALTKYGFFRDWQKDPNI